MPLPNQTQSEAAIPFFENESIAGEFNILTSRNIIAESKLNLVVINSSPVTVPLLYLAKELASIRFTGRLFAAPAPQKKPSPPYPKSKKT